MSFFRVMNVLNYQYEYIEDEQSANMKIQENKIIYLNQEAHRFNIAKEIIEGNNTTWCAADLENDPEEGVYKVFNHTTGQYEGVQGLSNAKARNQQLKDEFFYASNYSKYEVVEEMPPTTGGILGQMRADIPTRIM